MFVYLFDVINNLLVKFGLNGRIFRHLVAEVGQDGAGGLVASQQKCHALSNDFPLCQTDMDVCACVVVGLVGKQHQLDKVDYVGVWLKDESFAFF